MTFPVKTINADAEVYDACKLFSENNFRRLPVLENGEVIGIVTIRDVVRHFVPQLIKDLYQFRETPL